MIQSVLVTGGGSGIGAALAVELARRDRDVLISGRRKEALDAVSKTSHRISTCVGDITEPAHRAQLKAAMADLQEPRAVVHAAGYFQAGLLNSLSDEDWRRSFETNVEARWALSRDCAQSLERGRVLFIGSDAGSNPRVGGAAYSVAQAASETLRRSLQAEWAGTGISVGAFKPGLVDTDMVRGFMQLPAEQFPARSAYEAYITGGHIATPAIVAQFAAWLLLDVTAERFIEADWDIRDTEHHPEWADQPLYPGLT